MKLNLKMMMVFSLIMIISLFSFTSYTIDNSISGSDMYTSARFTNMSARISGELQKNLNLMSMTVDGLTQNISFMSSLNQFVRDDSEDQKMMAAAQKAALSSLYQSPMVDQYYRVSFIAPDGKYITSLADKDFDYTIPSDSLVQLLDSYTFPETSDEDMPYQIIAPQKDIFNAKSEVQIYGIIQPVRYFNNVIGYISIVNECTSLDYILNYIDNTLEVEAQINLNDNTPLYFSREIPRPYTTDISTGEIQSWTDPETNTTLDMMHTVIEPYNLHLYIAQDSKISSTGQHLLRLDVIKRALVILLIALFLIGIVSYSLTASIRRLTKRVKQMSSKSILLNDTASSETLNTTVTPQRDLEIHTLELAYNDMLHRVRKSTINEMALRESTLQAQLNALQTQINPHFIYNTLNIISSKSMEHGNFEIIEICDQFASMLRYSTDVQSRTATMREEIENVQNYLLLAQARYEDNLEFFIDIPDDMQNIKVPKLTLQPLVENALVHGYDGKNVVRKLSIIEKNLNGMFSIEIRDNGTGFSPETLTNLQHRISEIEAGNVSIEASGKHIGLINTCLRLYYYSKGAMRISIHNDNGAVITLTMPQNSLDTYNNQHPLI